MDDNFFTQHVDVINSVVVVVQLFYISRPIAIQSYVELSKAIFDNLPAKNEAVFVSRGVKKSCTENKSHLATLAANVLEPTMVQAFVWKWWGFRKDRLMENFDQPPTSACAARYTKARRKSVKKRL